MVEILEFSDQEFKITMDHMLRAFMGKVDNKQSHIGSGNRKMETLRKTEMLIKSYS